MWEKLKLSSPSPKPCPPRPNPNPKPKEIKNSSPIGTGGDTLITWATTTPSTPPITFNHEGVQSYMIRKKVINTHNF